MSLGVLLVKKSLTPFQVKSVRGSTRVMSSNAALAMYLAAPVRSRANAARESGKNITERFGPKDLVLLEDRMDRTGVLDRRTTF